MGVVAWTTTVRRSTSAGSCAVGFPAIQIAQVPGRRSCRRCRSRGHRAEAAMGQPAGVHVVQGAVAADGCRRAGIVAADHHARLVAQGAARARGRSQVIQPWEAPAWLRRALRTQGGLMPGLRSSALQHEPHRMSQCAACRANDCGSPGSGRSAAASGMAPRKATQSFGTSTGPAPFAEAIGGGGAHQQLDRRSGRQAPQRAWAAG